ncbi:MAG: ABC-2 transporter permease [Bacilli bacterium]
MENIGKLLRNEITLSKRDMGAVCFLIAVPLATIFTQVYGVFLSCFALFVFSFNPTRSDMSTIRMHQLLPISRKEYILAHYVYMLIGWTYVNGVTIFVGGLINSVSLTLVFFQLVVTSLFLSGAFFFYYGTRDSYGNFIFGSWIIFSAFCVFILSKKMELIFQRSIVENVGIVMGLSVLSFVCALCATLSLFKAKEWV